MKRAVFVCACALELLGCRGQTSTRPPIHLIGDMDWQPKYRPEAHSAFFADGRTMRPPVEGTVARGQLRADDAFYRGVDPATQQALAHSPLATTERLLRRGQERFDIFCSPCHDRTGAGHGMVVQRGFYPPIDLISQRVRDLPDGEIFHVISHGVRNMPSYGAQVPEDDRWAIVAWIRVLERSQHASLEDVPPEQRDHLAPEGSQ